MTSRHAEFEAFVLDLLDFIDEQVRRARGMTNGLSTLETGGLGRPLTSCRLANFVGRAGSLALRTNYGSV